MKKVLICTPMYNSVCTAGYTISMMNLLNSLVGNEKISINTLFALNESLIPKTRSLMVHSFLKSDFTHLLFIDSDISFEARELIHMIENAKDITCGIYPKKSIKWENVHSAVSSGVNHSLLPLHASEFLYHPIPEAHKEEDGLIEVDRAATGMMLISRHVFETLSDKVPVFKLENEQQNISMKDDEIKEFFYTTTDPKTNIFLHEDFNFCRLWKEAGGKIYASTTMKLQHIGTHVYG